MNVMKQMILISGKQGSGKTTTTKEMHRQLSAKGYEVEYFRFAHVIYEIHDLARHAIKDLKPNKFLWHKYLNPAMQQVVAIKARQIQEFAISRLFVYGFYDVADKTSVEVNDEPLFEYLLSWVTKRVLNPVDGVKDGELLQWLGTEWGRSKGENIWADICHNRILRWFNQTELKLTSQHLTMQVKKDYLANADQITIKGDSGKTKKLIAIIDDCRFENEFDIMSDALRVRLQASEEVRKARAEVWRTNTQHPSETGLDEYDEQGKFDMYFNTEGEVPAVHIATLIMAQLDKNSWKEKRK